MKQNKDSFNKASTLIALTVILSSVVYAWTGPSGTPPNNNVVTPLNVGVEGQAKLGGLGIGGPFLASGISSFESNVTIGSSTAPSLLTLLTIHGLLSTKKVQLEDIVAEGDTCSPNGLVARNTEGLVLSCQSGKWGAQAFAPSAGFTATGTVITRPSAGHTPAYKAGLLYTGTYTNTPNTSWYNTTKSIDITPTKSGLLTGSITTTGCHRKAGVTGYLLQYSTSYQIKDKDTNKFVSSGSSLSDILYDTCSTLNLPVIKALPKNTNGYTITFTNSWSSAEGAVQTPYYTSANAYLSDGKTIQYDYAGMVYSYNLEFY